MQLIAVQRILGLLLTLFSLTLLPPVAVGLWYGDGAVTAFILAFVVTLGTGLALWLPAAAFKVELRLRDGFVVVVAYWLVLGIFGALPLVLADAPPLSFTDAVFESFSGLTTTAATVLVGIDGLPHAILYYRQQLQWLGGMGIIVLAVAILPILGVGGMQIFRAETPGPMKDTRLTPRITETVKALGYIYLGLTVANAFAYWLAGMSPFDAIGHAFSTVSIGGSSTHELSIGYFNSALIEAVAVVFMLLAGMNFALHFIAWRSLSLRAYWADPEVRAYLTVLGAVAALTTAYLLYAGTFGNFGSALHHGIFQAVSIGTTAGFTTADYYAWPGFLPVMLLFVSFVGGCAGSTGGGMKVIRWLLIYHQAKREIRRLIHPSAEIQVKLASKVVNERVISSVWGFFALYVVTFAVMMLLLMATGLDQVTAFSAVAASLNNLGPGLGEVGANYAGLSDSAKWILVFAMMLGRLEIFTLLVLFTPGFWRR